MRKKPNFNMWTELTCRDFDRDLMNIIFAYIGWGCPLDEITTALERGIKGIEEIKELEKLK